MSASFLLIFQIWYFKLVYCRLPDCEEIFSKIKKENSNFVFINTEYDHVLATNSEYQKRNNEEDFHALQAVDKPFFCSLCNAYFVTQRYLNQHLDMHKEKPFKCDLCEKFYTRQVHLRAHISEVHIKDRPFKCNICEAVFSRKYTLFKHEKTHTAERPFKCEICGNAFGRRDTIQRHIKLTHNNGEPLACTICHVVFTMKKSLNQHMLSHKERST